MATNKTGKYWLGGIGAVLVTAGLVWWYWLDPQMGYDKKAFATVDALFTAINSHSDPQTSQCEARLAKLAQTGHISSDALARLEGIVARARSGNWERSAHELYDFMRSQRRDAAANASKGS